MIQRLFETTTGSSELSEQRTRMVEEQLRSRGIRDKRVLAAMAKIPREEFIGPQEVEHAYGDFPLPIGVGQTVSQPYIVAAMVEILDVRATDRVLEVGTGTGYQAAVLGELALGVWTVERHAALATRAQEILKRLAVLNVHVVRGDGSLGLSDQAPFDKILVAAAAPDIPQSLIDQLAGGGRLVLPVGSRVEQQIQLIRKINGEILVSKHDLCRFVPLVGQEGW